MMTEHEKTMIVRHRCLSAFVQVNHTGMAVLLNVFRILFYLHCRRASEQGSEENQVPVTKDLSSCTSQTTTTHVKPSLNETLKVCLVAYKGKAELQIPAYKVWQESKEMSCEGDENNGTIICLYLVFVSLRQMKVGVISRGLLCRAK